MPFGLEDLGGDSFRLGVDLAVSCPRQPVHTVLRPLLQTVEGAVPGEIVLHELDAGFHHALALRVAFPAEPDREAVSGLAALELVRVDDVAVVLVDGHEPVLVDDQFLRKAAENLEAGFQCAHEVDAGEVPGLPDEELVARMGQDEDDEVQADAACVLSNRVQDAEVGL